MNESISVGSSGVGFLLHFLQLLVHYFGSFFHLGADGHVEKFLRHVAAHVEGRDLVTHSVSSVLPEEECLLDKHAN